MAYLKSKTLFFTTSPRTPLKMIPEIQALYENFEGSKWNKNTQVEFIQKLAEGSPHFDFPKYVSLTSSFSASSFPVNPLPVSMK